MVRRKDGRWQEQITLPGKKPKVFLREDEERGETEDGGLAKGPGGRSDVCGLRG